jgi:hypothetical protein
MVAALLDLDEGAGAAGEVGRRDAPAVSRDRHDVGDARQPARPMRPRIRPCSLSLVAEDAGRRSGRADQASGAICAAQPVTTMRASGRSRRRRRMAWRAWRSASAVTAQVLTMTVVGQPRRGWPRIDLALVGVEAAAEGEDVDGRWHGQGVEVDVAAGRRWSRGRSSARGRQSRHSMSQRAAVGDDAGARGR